MKKTALRMGENICKWNNWQGINLQNLQTAHVAQKSAEDLNRHFSKENIEMDKAHGKMLNITDY